jgi:hypothetical protein
MRFGVLAVLAVGLLGLASCSSKTEAPRIQQMTPGTRLIYHGGKEGVYTMCDRGNRVYMNENGNFQVVPNGCPHGEP